MSKTKLDVNDPRHHQLIGIMAVFVDDYGYHPRELLELLDSVKKETYFTLLELYNEKHK